MTEPEWMNSLGRKRHKQLDDDISAEYHDAAISAVVLGLKALNHVFGFGLNKLSDLSAVWDRKLVEFQRTGDERHPDYLAAGSAGDLITDPLTTYADLSDRKRRQIAEFLTEVRLTAQGNTYALGREAIHEAFGIGPKRMLRLEKQWLRDLQRYHESREECEDGLRDWLEGIGFLWEGGRIFAYKDENGKRKRKKAAEAENARLEKKNKGW